jgi:hypothetical protein
MALTVNHPTLKEVRLTSYSPSVGASPVVAYTTAPFRGKIVKFGAVLGGTLTGDATVTLSIGGTNVTGTLTLTASGSAGGSVFTATPTAANTCNEDDAVAFTSASGTGASIPAQYFAIVQVG